MSQMMGWIENRPNKFLNQNFVRQGLPAKCKTRRFRFISLICGMINPESTKFGILTPYPTFSSGMEIVTTLPRASRPLSLSDLYCQALKDARDCWYLQYQVQSHESKAFWRPWQPTSWLAILRPMKRRVSTKRPMPSIFLFSFLRRTPPWSTEKRVRICTLILKTPWMSLIPTSRRQLPPLLALVRCRMGMISPAFVSIPILLWWLCFQLRAHSHSIISSCWCL